MILNYFFKNFQIFLLHHKYLYLFFKKFFFYFHYSQNYSIYNKFSCRYNGIYTAVLSLSQSYNRKLRQEWHRTHRVHVSPVSVSSTLE